MVFRTSTSYVKGPDFESWLCLLTMYTWPPPSISAFGLSLLWAAAWESLPPTWRPGLSSVWWPVVGIRQYRRLGSPDFSSSLPQKHPSTFLYLYFTLDFSSSKIYFKVSYLAYKLNASLLVNNEEYLGHLT